MLIPSNYTIALLLTILSAICWGSWANTQKLAGQKWRFELYYADYSLGVFLGALVICFTAGSANQADITFLDSMIGMALRKAAWALLAGVIFNIANVLLVAAISISGLSVAIPIGLGLATVIGVIWSSFINPQGSMSMLWAGLGFLVVGMVVNARAYSMMAHVRRAQEATGASQFTEAAPPKRVRKTGKTKSSTSKGILLSLIAGVFMGCFYPLIEFAREGDLGLAPYPILLFFAVGVLFSSFLLVPFLMNFPVEGEHLDLRRYFQGSKRNHLLGVLGGVIWMAGLAFNVLASSVPKTQNVGPAISSALGQGATLLAMAWGVFAWKEFAGTGSRVAMQVLVTFILYLIALALISLSPIY